MMSHRQLCVWGAAMRTCHAAVWKIKYNIDPPNAQLSCMASRPHSRQLCILLKTRDASYAIPGIYDTLALSSIKGRYSFAAVDHCRTIHSVHDPHEIPQSTDGQTGEHPTRRTDQVLDTEAEDGVDYSYFKTVVKELSKQHAEPIGSDPEEQRVTPVSLTPVNPRSPEEEGVAVDSTWSAAETRLEPVAQQHRESIAKTMAAVGLKHVKPALPAKSFSLAPYVNDSETLQNLVKIGVQLSSIERRHRNVAAQLLRLDFDRHVKPVLFFLRDVGIPEDSLGDVLTRNPVMLVELVENMETRVKYLRSKRFSADDVAGILLHAPRIITMTTSAIDGRLGYLQKIFQLSGNELRTTVIRFPKIVTWPMDQLRLNRTAVHEFCGFSTDEQKQLLQADPKLYTTNPRAIIDRFDFLHNTVGASHAQIIAWATCLRTSVELIKSRHRFLVHLGRAQFDPTHENFVSVRALCSGRDVEFCKNVAKVPRAEYDNFLKTL